MPIHPPYLQPSYLEACLRDTLHLHPPLGTDEEDLYLGVTLLQRLGDGDGGEDMTTGTPSTDDDSLYHRYAINWV